MTLDELMNEGERRAHADACLAAIASIGGDPATVGELVAALREIHAAFIAPKESTQWHLGICDAIIDSRAVLAKLPENSNEND